MNWRIQYCIEHFIAICIGIVPFFLYAYLYIEKGNSTFVINSITYEVVPGLDFRLSVYYFLIFIVPLLLFSIWFITSKGNFKFVILIPIAFYLFKSVQSFFSSFSNFYSSSVPHYIYIVLVYSMCLLLLHVLLRKKPNYEYPITWKHSSFIRKRFYLSKKVVLMLSDLKIKVSTKEYLYNLITLQNSIPKGVNFKNSYSFRKKSWLILFKIYLLILPIFYCSYLLVSPEANINLFYMIKHNNGFSDARTYVHFCLSKLILVIAFTVWYIVNEYWWRTIIFIPIILYTFQFYEAAFGSSQQFDEVEYVRAIPLICLSILITVFMSKLYRRALQSDAISKKIEEETDSILRKVSNGFS